MTADDVKGNGKGDMCGRTEGTRLEKVIQFVANRSVD